MENISIDFINSKININYDEIIELKNECFGKRLFNYIPNNIIIAQNCNLSNKIIGYCGIQFYNNCLHLESLCVKKEYRCNGIGKMIIDKAYEISKLLDKCLKLEINKNALNFKKLLLFYNKCNFKIIKENENLLYLKLK